MLVQWCHGAPGMVASLAQTFPSERSEALDTLLLQAGELTWQAGPLKKGSGLCHGTAGNGYAFLKLHQRTGDELWLVRARQFAMHAIGQYQQSRALYGASRYTLWTGDLGLAVYLWHCITTEAALPSLDVM
ncbi:MAG: LanC-like protein [Pseudanabaenales cyanobacterium]|nr:LanC-like protein [Pseudanabaenales cyanobacterium]